MELHNEDGRAKHGLFRGTFEDSPQVCGTCRRVLDETCPNRAYEFGKFEYFDSCHGWVVRRD